MSILSTREWATLIWGCIFMLYVLCHREIRKSLWNVIVIFFGKKLRILWEIILLYVLTITIVFCYLPIWENIYIKDIIIWFLFSGLIYCMNAVSSEADETYIKKILKENLKFTMILEFFMSTFTFNIWIELAIIPVITIITVMNVIAERKEEYKSVHKLLDSVLAIAGFWIFYETIKIGINEYKQLNIINTLVSFMIPIVYLILIIPLEYLLELYSKYEVLFLRMTFKEEKDKRIRLHHRIAVLRECNFSVRKILLFQREYMIQMYALMKEDEFNQLMQKFRSACKRMTS
ncbi:hypothetical protein [Eubacterium ventriosum]|jgi:hypothetical protein|uniref:hypothetical protein n=1 Tax=Eubacterium ventriosum TaxID=39496 RepID=UPI001C02B0D2|nr:hypothetical protein [Eubacterium ventriosum]MBT9692206.1 hypothetical protein [Eubacterium ventriosum]